MRAVACVVFCVVIACTLRAVAAESGLPELVKRTSPSVVFIKARGERGQTWTASGFVVRDTKLVVTAYHVVEGAKRLEITLPSKEQLRAVRVFSYNQDADLAVIEVKGELPEGLEVGEATSVETGQDIIVISNPVGLANTVTRGIVSAIREDEGVQWTQISAPISPGSSGGPILSTAGDVVGVVSYAYSGRHAQNLNFGASVAHLAELLKTENPLEIGKIEKRVEEGDRAMAEKYAKEGWFHLLRRDDRWKASEYFQVALSYDDSVGEAIAGSYYCLALQGTYSPDIEQILEEADAPYEACLTMANICERLRKHVLARQYYQKAHEVEPERPEVYLVAAFNYAQARNVEKTKHHAKKAAELDKSLEAAGLYYEGVARQTPQRFQDSLALYEKCCELDPEHDRARGELANCYMGMQNYARAQELAEQVMARSPHLPSSRVTLAVCYVMQLGEIARANELLDEEVAMFPRREADVGNIRKMLATSRPKFELEMANSRGVEHTEGDRTWRDYRLMVRIKNLTNERRGGTLQIEYYDEQGELLLVNTLTIPEIDPGATRVVVDTVTEEATVDRISHYFLRAD